MSVRGLNELIVALELSRREKTVSARSVSEFEAKGKTGKRTEWPEQSETRKEGEEKWQTCWYCRDQQRACRMAQASTEKTNWACRKGTSTSSTTK